MKPTEASSLGEVMAMRDPETARAEADSIVSMKTVPTPNGEGYVKVDEAEEQIPLYTLPEILVEIRTTLEKMSNIRSLRSMCNKIINLTEQIEEIYEEGPEVPPINCPACYNGSMSPGCPVCDGTGIIHNAVPYV